VAKFVIAAPSARGFAEAAVACGHAVIALDAFADADTKRVASQTFKLKFNENIVDEADFKHVFSRLNLAEIDGFCYGSLFDNCPDLLDCVAHRIRLVGNAPEVMRLAKGFEFFKLLDDLNIQHPEVSINKPFALSLSKVDEWFDKLATNGRGAWLAKQLGGSGGTHIRSAHQVKDGHYFQHKVVGTPVSMLFVADGKTVKTIGFNQQFIAPTIEMPYRFAGAVGNIALQPNIHKAFEHAAQQLTSALKLRGLNNLDAVLENEGCDGEKLWILELNPRLSASFNLYENLFKLHLRACAGDLVDFKLQHSSKSHLILYADEALEIPANFAWPNWAVDIPSTESAKIALDEPICSVFAEAQTAEAASNLVQQRAEKLRGMLY
jgi:uncharacterized protein